MREIKFRVWDKIKNKWIEDVHIYLNGEIREYSDDDGGKSGMWEHDCSKNENLILMQFTGLHDKNGKEIYEGDILEYKFNKLVDFRNGKKVEPEWIKERRVMRFIEDRFSFAMDIKNPNYFEYPSISEVIGNIYENKELLNQEAE